MPHPDMYTNNGHPDEGLLHEWLDDQLSPTDAAEVQAHIASCAECGALVAEARGLIAASHRILSALDEVPAGVIPANFVQSDSTAAAVSNADAVAANAVRNSDGVLAIDNARNTSRAAVQSRRFVWKRAGSIAALLLFAVTSGVFILRGDDVTVPLATVAPELPKSEPVTIAKSADRDAATANDAGANAPVPGPVASRDAVEAERAAVASGNSAAKRSAFSAPASKPPIRSEPPFAGRTLDESRMIDPNAERLAKERNTRALAEARTLLQQAASASSGAAKTEASASGKDAGANASATTATTTNPNPANTKAGTATAGLGSGVGAGSGAPAAVVAASPPGVADQTAIRTDTTARAAAAGGAGARGGSGGGGFGGRGGGGGGRAGRVPPPTVANATGAGSVGNAPPPGSTMAAPPVASAPPASRADSTTNTRVGTTQMLASPERGVDSVGRPAPLAAASAALNGRAAGFSLLSSEASAFDSITLTRSVCTPNCEFTTLNINALGTVRYIVGSGNTARVKMAQLTTNERSALLALLVRSLPTATGRTGNTACVIAAGRGSGTTPQLDLLLSFPGVSTLRPEPRCTKSIVEIREMSDAIDSIARVDALKRSMPPNP